MQELRLKPSLDTVDLCIHVIRLWSVGMGMGGRTGGACAAAPYPNHTHPQEPQVDSLAHVRSSCIHHRLLMINKQEVLQASLLKCYAVQHLTDARYQEFCGPGCSWGVNAGKFDTEEVLSVVWENQWWVLILGIIGNQ